MQQLMPQRAQVILEAVNALLRQAVECEEWERVQALAALHERLRVAQYVEEEASTRDALYVLVHREVGPLRTFFTRDDAEAELVAAFSDKPEWIGDLWIEPFRLRVQDQEG